MGAHLLGENFVLSDPFLFSLRFVLVKKCEKSPLRCKNVKGRDQLISMRIVRCLAVI